MHIIQSAIRKGTVADIYCSDVAYWAGLLLIWDLLVVVLALWLAPPLLAAAAASAPLMTNAAVFGAGA